MIAIIVKDEFAASHFLTCVPDGHKCRNLHGHNYNVEVTLAHYFKEIDGMLADFSDCKRVVHGIITMFDHKLLIPKDYQEQFKNIVKSAEPPWQIMLIKGSHTTTENIVQTMWDLLTKTIQVNYPDTLYLAKLKISETDGNTIVKWRWK